MKIQYFYLKPHLKTDNINLLHDVQFLKLS